MSCDPVHAVKHPPVFGQDHGVGEVAVQNAFGVTGHAANRWLLRRGKPGHLVQSDDLLDIDLLNLELFRELPDPLDLPDRALAAPALYVPSSHGPKDTRASRECLIARGLAPE